MSPTSTLPPGARLAATVTVPASLGFIPVAIHFDLFRILCELGPSSAAQVASACNARTLPSPAIGELLAADTLFIMAGLGLVDCVEDQFHANDMTHHMVNMPSAQHGALHFTTEGLMAGAFLYSKLRDTGFAYPFSDADGPIQHAYRLMGEEHLATQHTYAIMEQQGRMDSFNQFMVGKFLKFGTFPERAESMGYDLGAVLQSPLEGPVAVDIGGGHGELLLEIQSAFPHLRRDQLVVQEFNTEITEIDGLRLMEWNYKTAPDQPITGARVYLLQHILHNLPDLDAVSLLQKLSRALSSSSRLLIIEYAKNKTYTNLHASMIALYGGRERSSTEWHQLASVCGLRVTFEKYLAAGESLVEMQVV
ncbi:hypothetical protein N7492_007883 [Penicillium capsulatum]|uniref:O-methyltransferase C-terminal domain-containing protein n=1 Tax=Penicillium capsulatum TaxID=69766 RepID=A0A9W9I2R3_9EURO|nr:hypothetical protein N7492_007883 [Penicillium capsulatum]KAJ6117714.1 hypothetical protein N7512_007439 [Penicillium capsulatum]